jgi:hypothetical protein
VRKRIISAVKRVEFVNDRMSYIILRGRWSHVFVLNVHTPTEGRTDDVKDSFYEELERAFDKFPKYHRNILLGQFNAKVDTREMSNPTEKMNIYTKSTVGGTSSAVVCVCVCVCVPKGRPLFRLQQDECVDYIYICMYICIYKYVYICIYIYMLYQT